jgi:hypothetical protein
MVIIPIEFCSESNFMPIPNLSANFDILPLSKYYLSLAIITIQQEMKYDLT